VNEIYRGSHGVPRLINLICDRALLAGYAAQTRDIQPDHVRKAIAALRGEDAEVSANMIAPGQPRWRYRAAVIGTVVVVAAVSVGVAFWPRHDTTAPDEALYWRATTEATATDAEHDLQTFVSSYPTSARYDDALLRLAQLELSRGDRAGALQHLTQLAQHAPSGIMHTRAVVLASTASIDAGDTTTACQTPAPAAASAAGDTTLARQLAAVTATCSSHTAGVGGAAPVSAAAAAADSVTLAAKTPADTAAAQTRSTRAAAKPAGGVRP
jgi:hypothetical protein